METKSKYGEKTYDELNATEFKKVSNSKELLQNARATPAKGFRVPTKQEIKKAEDAVKTYSKTKADEFIAEYQHLIEYYGIELDLEGFELVGARTYRPKLGLTPYVKKTEPELKPWSEAQKENLQKRQNCTHKLDAEGNVCEKCNLAPKNWGEDDKGTNKEYDDGAYTRIKESEKEEAADAKDEAKQ